MAALLELRGVSKSFGGLLCIDRLDLHVDEGEIVSVIGPNGAGKTTLFNVITGVYTPDGGKVQFEGRDIAGESPAVVDHRRAAVPVIDQQRDRRLEPHDGL